MTINGINSVAVQHIVERCKAEGKKAKDIATELRISGYKVTTAFVCTCEKTAFFDTAAGLHVRQLT